MERWNAFARVRQDLFGFADLLALHPGARGVLAVQVTSAAHVAERRRKIRNEPRARTWLACGNRIAVHGWVKRGPRGGRKVWECREIEVTELDFP